MVPVRLTIASSKPKPARTPGSTDQHTYSAFIPPPPGPQSECQTHGPPPQHGEVPPPEGTKCRNHCRPRNPQNVPEDSVLEGEIAAPLPSPEKRSKNFPHLKVEWADSEGMRSIVVRPQTNVCKSLPM